MPRVNVKDKRKQQLIDANIASIAKRGLSETTIAHVSQGAGMSRGIVNFYFTTKESMMQETCQHLADEYAGAWERVVEKAEGEAPEAQLKQIIAAQFQSALCNQKKLSVWVAFWGHASSHAAYRKIVAEADARFEAKLAEIWAQVKDASVLPEVFAYELQALIRGSQLNFLLSAANATREDLAQKCEAYLNRSLSAEAAPVAAAAPKKEKIAKAVKVAAEDNVTALKKPEASAEEKAAKKKAEKPKAEEAAAALGDLFAMGR